MKICTSFPLKVLEKNKQLRIKITMVRTQTYFVKGILTANVDIVLFVHHLLSLKCKSVLNLLEYVNTHLKSFIFNQPK